MRAWIAAGAALLLVGVVVLWPAGQDEGFEIYHYDSLSHPGGFEEVFELRAVVGAVATTNVTVWVDGQPVEATWDDEDGLLSEGDRFRFVMEAFDFQRDMWLEADGKRLWSGSFGSGAGTPL